MGYQVKEPYLLEIKYYLQTTIIIKIHEDNNENVSIMPTLLNINKHGFLN